MKKLVLALCLSVSVMFSYADIWKSPLVLGDKQVVLVMDHITADSSSDGKLFSASFQIQDGQSVDSLIAVVSGCQTMEGKMMVFTTDGKPIVTAPYVEWKLTGKDPSDVIATMTCAAAYKKNLVKDKVSKTM